MDLLNLSDSQGRFHDMKPSLLIASNNSIDDFHKFLLTTILSLVRCLVKKFILFTFCRQEHWSVRKTSRVRSDGSNHEEELYYKDRTVIWSRGHSTTASRLQKTITTEHPILQASFVKFSSEVVNTSDEKVPTTKMQLPFLFGLSLTLVVCLHLTEIQVPSICIVHDIGLTVIADSGEEYYCSLPFMVKNVWPIDGKLLIERALTKKDISGSASQAKELPTLFSLKHPLDEPSPMLAKTGTLGKLQFMQDAVQNVIFSNTDPDIVVTFDLSLGLHSVWSLRQTKSDEINTAMKLLDSTAGSALLPSFVATPRGTQSSGTLAGLSSSAQSRLSASSISSAAFSPASFRHQYTSSRAASPMTTSRPHTPAASAVKNISQSSLGSHVTPALRKSRSSLGTAYSPVMSILATPCADINEPLTPDLCLELGWTESSGRGEGVLSRASKVFITRDLCEQKYLCFLVRQHQQLRCLKFSASNDKSQLIFGSITNVPALDAEPLDTMNMLIVLDTSSSLVLYTGLVKISRILVPGIHQVLSNRIVAPGLPRPSTPLDSHILTGTPSSSNFVHTTDDQVMLLSPVGVDLSVNMDSSILSDDLSFSSPGMGRTIKSLRDALGDQFTLVCSGGTLLRTSIPPFTHLQLGVSSSSSSPTVAVKKHKPSGCDEDWEYLLGSCYHQEVDQDLPSSTSSRSILKSGTEETKLHRLHHKSSEQVASLACQLAKDVGWSEYVEHYCRLHPHLVSIMEQEHSQLKPDQRVLLPEPSGYSTLPPCFNRWLYNSILGNPQDPFPHMDFICKKTHQLIAIYSLYFNKIPSSVQFVDTLFRRLSIAAHMPLILMKQCSSSREGEPSSGWPESAYALLVRKDLSKQSDWLQRSKGCLKEISTQSKSDSKGKPADTDGMEGLDDDLLKFRFPDDLRITEVKKLLQSARPVVIALTQKPEVSDHEFLEQQEMRLLLVSQRTMALPLARNTNIAFQHIDVPDNVRDWPWFHNGVAAGLQLGPNDSKIDSAWIVYNQPEGKNLTNEFGGFLMALGLTGHLTKLFRMVLHKYLCSSHEMTGIGLALGLAAAKKGTMDVAVTKILSLHISALLPPTSTELAVPHNLQVAAILGIGLVYQGTAHRHMAEVLLGEIGRPPGPELENCADRESYSLAAGLALGMVLLKHGSDAVGLSDLELANQLYLYMAGGHKRPSSHYNSLDTGKSPCYQIQEGDQVNVDVTSPGATLALGLMFLQTGNKAVAQWLAVPETPYLLEFVKPDFLLLRTLSRGLVLWDDIRPTEDWIKSNIPKVVQKYALRKMTAQEEGEEEIDAQTMSQSSCCIIAGACMALGLRFAGTANNAAFLCLLKFAEQFVQLGSQSVAELAGKATIEKCLNTVGVSLAMVMAGTGNLKVLRLARALRSRVSDDVTYGNHMAISSMIGLLFLGGGRFTLSNSAEAVAALICSFYPVFPNNSKDNRYHLQAFRHLYVLASEPRLVLPKEVSSGDMCYVPLEIIFKKTIWHGEHCVQMLAPCIIPELSQIKELRIIGPRYMPITLRPESDLQLLKQILRLGGVLFVKQRAGHLSYAEDPKDAELLLSPLMFECVIQEKLNILPVLLEIYATLERLRRDLSPIDLWQLKLVLSFASKCSEAACLNGRSSIKAQLISSETCQLLQAEVEGILIKCLQENKDLVQQYLIQGKQPHTKDDFAKLACFLNYFHLPSAARINALQVTGKVQSLPVLESLQYKD
ncbi:putative anaphase-promoting complex subunit 1 isoform X3 [Apostichopus japonicus]|uniref:Putative anaphase-promoting complex subunit 1 isoform X3 n=1 Tax=Stichopus japonicus TaxID=307972 RepID=A0A2G8K4E5_STIJA|nr:putative anaphase-promoting complex subunit 1 isoform X3 [Apostichopus japonicus]